MPGTRRLVGRIPDLPDHGGSELGVACWYSHNALGAGRWALGNSTGTVNVNRARTYVPSDYCTRDHPRAGGKHARAPGHPVAGCRRSAPHWAKRVHAGQRLPVRVVVCSGLHESGTVHSLDGGRPRETLAGREIGRSNAPSHLLRELCRPREDMRTVAGYFAASTVTSRRPSRPRATWPSTPRTSSVTRSASLQ